MMKQNKFLKKEVVGVLSVKDKSKALTTFDTMVITGGAVRKL